MSKTFEPKAVDGVLRVLDVALAGALLVVCSPLLVLSAIALLGSGTRGVLYHGARVGRGGVIFTMLKFRTLKPEAEARIGRYSGIELTRMTAEEQTRVGHILRATKLDELPQLWNVLRGEMSIVGPRPIRPRFFEELARDIPGYWQRLVVRPGITGFAQLRLTRDMTWAEKLAHDFEYIADRGVRLYLEIVAETAWLVISGRAPRDVPLGMCGICGIVRGDGRAVDPALLGAMSDDAAPPRAGQRGGGRARRGRAGGAAAGDHRPRGRRPADRQRGRADRRRPERRDLQPRRAAGGARGGRPPLPHAALRHRGARPPLRAARAALRRAAAGHVRGRGVGLASAAGSCSRAIASGSSRSTTATGPTSRSPPS